MRVPRSERLLLGGAVAALVAGLWFGTSEARQQDAVGARAGDRFSSTSHAPVPAELSRMWFAPAQGSGGGLAPALADFARGARLLDDEDNAAAALPLVSAGALAASPVAEYSRYYTGLALQRLGRLEEAEAAFAAVAAAKVEGHLPEDATLRQAEIRETRGDFAGAVALYTPLLQRRLGAPHVAWLRAGVAFEAAGNRDAALDAYRRVFYEYPLSPEGDLAESALLRLNAISPRTPELVARERKRADVLFSSRRWGPAQKAYDRVRAFSEGAQKQAVSVRISACDINLGRHRQGRLALQPYLNLDGAAGTEARFYHLAATRGIGRHDEYEKLAAAFVRDYPTSPFAEQALDLLATHYILVDEDDRAEEVFRRTVKEYPSGRYTERAVWRAGWWAYRRGEFADTISLFEHGLASFPRSDYRPSWLYWTGKAYDKLGQPANATARFRLAATDYLNTYYGRLSYTQLQARKEASLTPAVQLGAAAPRSPELPTSERIATLISVGLYQEALNELQYAQRVWGDSPQLMATVALVQNRLGNLRLGINAMRRAYPQFMASGGEQLPDEILRVIFPVNFWQLLEQHAKARGLDPYLIAALVAQESTFDPVIRSSANAIGLMQVLPTTGSRYARKLGIPRFSAARLTNPEVNVRIGTTYFAELVQRFGGAHFALASYNAGESRVVRWQREKPGLPQDEFIDDIPFPETQNYVKRILGTADDYRRLYSNRPVPSMDYATATPASKAAAPKRATGKAVSKKKAPAKKAPARKAPAKKKKG